MSAHETMNLKLIVWRQAGPTEPGRFETYEARDITPHHSFLEMLDVVNEELIKTGKEPELHKEPLKFENVHLAVRSYK
jgi:succinate dehydrogenase / fumarate reductase iron-sulfur subunit